MRRLLVGLVALVFAIVMGLVIARVVDLSRENEAMHADLLSLDAQFDELGIEPDVEIEPPAGERGEQGERGEPGRDGRDATSAQIDASVAGWFVRNPLIDQPDPDDPEIQDAETQDPEQQDAEVQDDEPDDPDPDDPETQDPEIDDPDPNGAACPPSYSLQPDILRGDEVLLCTRDPEPAP